jgi:S1 RNA binding domain/Zc3h12a-like Ribonuclease NYN domain
MARHHVVVDGSNLATEGRTVPSLAQLDEAIEAFAAEHPGVTLTVVVDATFPHRIDASEREAYEEAAANGAVVSPPAGAVGRGDGFLLQIADRTGGAVLSNDSFQEFHPTYGWLFDTGRLVGAKPVPEVGWIFSLRTPVRAGKKAGKTPKLVADAIKEASADALAPDKPKRRRRRGKESPGAVNDPDPFVRFVAEHPPGSEVEGRVDAYASHGAFVDVDGVRGYVPLAAMGDPAPASAREVLRKGDTRRFVVQAVDAPRRGVELAIPEFAHVSGAPTEETVEAGILEGSARTRRRRRQRQAAKERAKSTKVTKKKVTKKKVTKKKVTKKKAAPKKKAKARKSAT